MIKEEFEKFKNHRSVKKWSVDVFDKTKWSTGSWFTLQRTLRKSKEHKENGKLYEKLREDCKKYIFDEIFNFFPEEIDEIDLWYKKIITREYGLSYLSIGHRQKMVNILIKYFLTYFHTTKDTDIEFCKIFNRNISHIHIPIDNIVLKSIYKIGTIKPMLSSSKKTTTIKISNSFNDLILFLFPIIRKISKN